MHAAGQRLVFCAVLVVFTAMSTGEAQASCGDYLASHAANDEMSGRTHSFQHADSKSDAALSGEETVPHRQPCHGPNCHRGSQLPEPATPFSIERIGAEQYGLPTDVTAAWSLSLCGPVTIADPLQTRGCCDRVERPPRTLFVVL